MNSWEVANGLYHCTDDILAPLGRKLAHVLSIQNEHTGALWTVKQYKDNEFQINGNQAIVFLGNTEITKSYIDILPELFSKFGTRCLYEGPKAVLIAEEPDYINPEDIETMSREVKKNSKDLHRLAKSMLKAKLDVHYATTERSVMRPYYIPPEKSLFGSYLRYLFYLIKDNPKLTREYRNLQYEYALSRFLKDEFGKYMNGFQTC